MKLSRMLRRKGRGKNEETFDQRMAAALTAEIEGYAETIFYFAIETGQPMPPRHLVESAAKAVYTKALEPIRLAAVEKGLSGDEIAACLGLISSHAQVKFQERWHELERRRAQIAASGQDAWMH